MANVLLLTRKTENNHDLSETIKSLNAECKKCTPITPLECISRCHVYKLKNELRTLRQMMDNPNYLRDLFNVLKNGTRLQILQAIANGRYSVSGLQQELKKTGHRHSQDNINKEYLRPILAVGLATEAREEYYATTFGGRLTEQLGYFPEFAEKLPAQSECHEETLLKFLLSGPKTSEEIELVISSKVASRILKRLRSTRLIETPKARDYVFFFRSKRDANKEILTPTEQKIYDGVNYEGISAGKLAKKTALSLRRTYKYLKGLRGRKLVFIRRTPKTYSLTCKGKKLASVLLKLQEIVEDTWNSSKQITQDTSVIFNIGDLSDQAFIR
jgi:predicted transcriptional regulator